MKRLSIAAVSAALLCASPAFAQMSGGAVRILVLNDQSGGFSDNNGAGSLIAAQMAVEDFGGKVAGAPIEVLVADHLNKPDVGSSVAREWIDTRGVDAVVDVPVSSVALAVNSIVRDRNKVLLLSSAGASNFVQPPACNPNVVQWTSDIWVLANASVNSAFKEGLDTWFIIYADFTSGNAFRDDIRTLVAQKGGKVVGEAAHPNFASDFSSQIAKAQASGAKIVAIASFGNDMTNIAKQANEFGLTRKGQKLMALNAFITDIDALGLNGARGLTFTNSFYWDRNEQTRAWSRRFMTRHRGRAPTMNQAGVYASVLHYLKAVQATKSDDGKSVVRKMKELPTDDPLFGKGTIRADGRKLHDFYTYRVKSASESKGPWDYYDLVATIPAKDAFRPMLPECDFSK